MKKIIIAALFLTAFLVLSTYASAATITVPGDYPTIQGAIDAANPGDTVQVAPGTYYENLLIDKDLTLQGDDPDTTIIDAGGSGHVISVSSGVMAAISSLTITGGSSNYGGGIYTDNGTLTISNSTFSGNSASRYGGGIYTDSGPLTISNSTFSSNSAIWGGGAINTNSGTLIISISTFSDNSASRYGGGIYTKSGGTLTINNSTFSGNSFTGSGAGAGAISSYNSTLTISNSTFSGNSADWASGGAIVTDSGTLAISNSTFSGNSADRFAGAIYSYNGPLTISNSTISGNSATTGGGIFAYYSTVQVKNTIVANSLLGGDCAIQLSTSTFDARGNNFSTDGTCPGFTQVTAAQLNLDVLALNPPGVTETHALLPGSVAIDAAEDCTDFDGNPVTTDQRGVFRPQGPNCDVGAFEYYVNDCEEDLNAANESLDEASAALLEIQSLLSTPRGKRRSSSNYTGELGSSLNDIIQMLLAPPGRNISRNKPDDRHDRHSKHGRVE
jgi:predicted outer membrane repeat protein